MSDDESVELHSETPGAISAVIEYLQSATDADKAILIERYPILLEDEADNILAQIEDVHRQRGDKAAARAIDGTRFALRQRRLHGADQAVLQQAILAAFTQSSPDGPSIAALASRYPELLRPEADQAFDTLRKESKGELDWFLDLLQEAVVEARVAAAALDKGNPVPQRPQAERVRRSGLAPKEKIEAFARGIDAAQFGTTPAKLKALLTAMSQAESVDDISKVHDAEALSRDPAFLERMAIARDECPIPRHALTIFWEAAEFAAPREAPDALSTAYDEWNKAVRSDDPGKIARLGEKIAGSDAFEGAPEYFKLRILMETAIAWLKLYQQDGERLALDQANHIFSEATRESRTGSPSFTFATTLGGHAMLLKYRLTHDPDDGETAILVLSYAVANHMNRIPSLLPQAGLDLVDAYLLRFDRDGADGDLTSAGEMFSYTLGWSQEGLEPDEWPDLARSKALLSELSARLGEAGHTAMLDDVIVAAEAFLDAHDR